MDEDRRTPDQVVADAHRQLEAIKSQLNPGSWSTVPTSRGLYTLVDPQHAKSLSRHRWYAVISRGDHIYAVTDFLGKRIAMQRMVVALSDPKTNPFEIKNVSFANKCSLDCRSYNLRDRTNRVAAMRNRRKKRGSSSDYKGVRAIKRANGGIRYRVEIGVKGSSVYLGQYSSEQAAGEVYDAAATILFEGAAMYNFPDNPPSAAAIEFATNRIRRWRAKAK